MSNAAPRYDHVINQGAMYALRTIVTDESGTPIDLTAYSATYKARAEFDEGTVLFDLTTTSPSMISMGANGELNVDLPPEDTESMTPGTYKFTLNIWPTAQPAAVTRALYGIIEVCAQVVTS